MRSSTVFSVVSTLSLPPRRPLCVPAQWLLHWSLFVFANYPEVKGDATAAGAGVNRGGRDKLVESFMEEPNLTAIQLNCPWLLRYVTAAVLTSSDKRRQAHLRALLRVVSQEGGAAADPVRGGEREAVAGQQTTPHASSRRQIVDFVASVLLRFDFDGAQAKLAQCESVIVTDFFLSYLTTPGEFMEAARHFIFETYCRLHQTVDLGVLAAKLHMGEPDAERWVVELIRGASLDAKIDATGRQVIMTVPAPSVYQAVIDKTRELSVRTRVLADSIEAHAGGGGGGGDRRERY